MNHRFIRLFFLLITIILTVFLTIILSSNFEKYSNKINFYKKVIFEHIPANAQSLYASNKIIEGNDFKLELKTGVYPYITTRTAGIFLSDSNKIEIYEQYKVDKTLKKFNYNYTVKGAKPTYKFNGGIKNIFKYKGDFFCLICMKEDETSNYFVSILNLSKKKEIFRTPNILKTEEVLDFTAIGGAVTEYGDDLLIYIAAPSLEANPITNLAFDVKSPYGKLLLFKSDDLVNSKSTKTDFTIFSYGHRNMQGITKVGNNIYGVEHGPKGGDEINFIEQGKNYGWPKVSFGSHYAGGQYPMTDSTLEIEQPIYTFKPSVAPSDIIECPCGLSKKYKPFDCVLISTLRDQSILVGIIDPKSHHVLSIEKLDVGMRVREFLKTKDDRVFISADGFGVFELKFSDIVPDKP